MEIEHDNEAEMSDEVDGTEFTPNSGISIMEPEKPVEVCTWMDKTVRQLKKSEREKLIEGFNNGVEDPYFKVMRMKNGQMRINKRTNPLNENVENAHEVAAEKVQKQFNGKRLTDNQLLLEHIIDLERKMVEMKFKHKKLKKRYNKLEQDIFDESDEEHGQPTEVEVKYDEPEPKQHITATKVTPGLEVNSEPAPTEIRVRKPMKKASWRTYIQSM